MPTGIAIFPPFCLSKRGHHSLERGGDNVLSRRQGGKLLRQHQRNAAAATVGGAGASVAPEERGGEREGSAMGVRPLQEVSREPLYDEL